MRCTAIAFPQWLPRCVTRRCLGNDEGSDISVFGDTSQYYIILYYIRYNRQVLTNFWYEFHIAEQEKKNAQQHMCPEIFICELQLKKYIYNMRFIARLNTSHHRPPYPSKDAGAVADPLTGIRSAWWSPSSFSTGAAFRRLHMKIQRIRIRLAWSPYSGSSSTYPSAMTGVIGNISHGRAKMCRNTIKHIPHLCWLPGKGKDIPITRHGGP
jgi:hypothetical protein